MLLGQKSVLREGGMSVKETIRNVGQRGPIDCKARPAISIGRLGAAAHMTGPRGAIPTPRMSRRRRPKTSPGILHPLSGPPFRLLCSWPPWRLVLSRHQRRTNARHMPSPQRSVGSETLIEMPNPTPDVSVQPIVIVGAGGHAKVIIELIQAQGCYRVVGLIDADPTPRTVLGVQVIGADRDLVRLRGSGINKAFVALGDNRRRVAIGRELENMGFEMINAISRAAVISPSAQLGQGVAIMAGAVLNAASTIGDFAIVNTGALIDHDATIAEGAHIGPGCALAGNVRIGRLACLGVGTSATPGTTVGAGALVGAGACIVRDIPDAAVARGVPAKVVNLQQDRKL